MNKCSSSFIETKYKPDYTFTILQYPEVSKCKQGGNSPSVTVIDCGTVARCSPVYENNAKVLLTWLHVVVILFTLDKSSCVSDTERVHQSALIICICFALKLSAILEHC
ncbi:hypothetical protein T12_1653 [Trichinella patagoniensis]|uniref:Uncharacterized protein n=1 Tax=Trichinella patagoniensis TaxID=990121 RepID=A0A0V1A4S3_9BILA|nr:hypothetical protein T12_1653 [Trichinella patagoniensis]